MSSISDVPRFFLYGEESDSNNSEFVHVETIAARSETRGWRIKPHRHGKLFQILVLDSGNAEISLDNKKIHVNNASVIAIPTGVVHGFVFSPNTEGYVVSIAEPMIQHSALSYAESVFETVLDKPRVLLFSTEDKVLTQLHDYCNLLSSELNAHDVGMRQASEWLAKMILLTLFRAIKQQDEETNVGSSINSHYYQFQKLLENNYRRHWTVAQYAQELQTSVSTLNRVCRKSKGVAAKSIIAERLFVEAKRSLLYTQLHVDQIAYNLGFEDPAYFSRFFKNKSGLSPTSFRQLNPFDTEY